MKSIVLTEIPDADARLTLSDDAGKVLAQVDLCWNETPIYDGEKIGTIGGFQATDAASTQQILDAACEHLKSLGIHTAVGPMDGNTWKYHRFVIESDGRPPFLLEPENPAEYANWWLSSGFSELSHYSSSVMPLNGKSVISPALKNRILSTGIELNDLDPDNFENELRAIHAISLRSFSGNFLYTPLAESDFLAAYMKIRNHVDPALVKLARRDGGLVGFVFGIPDLAAVQRGEKPALIVKTLAVDPAARAAGLGSLLVDELHRAAEQKGFTQAIHALQHETNSSLKITDRQHGKAFRRYALYLKSL